MKIIFIIGSICTIFGGLAIMWSIFKPSHRIWPVTHLTPFKFIIIWGVTFLAFGACIGLSILNWNSLGLPKAVRFGIGIPLIIIGHIIVYAGVCTIGLAATSGAKVSLRTNGIYKYSRNPQYLADISSLIGWGILCASIWATPLITGIIAIFILTPFAEEPWLREVYGHKYEDYCQKTRRFL